MVAVAAGDQPVRAAWRVTVTATGLRRDVFVDAASGAVVHVREGLLAAAARGSGIDVHGQRVPLDISAMGRGRWQLRDETRGVQTAAGLSARSPLASTDPSRWDEDGFGAGAAVSAHAGAGQVLDYLAETFDRHGLDGKAGALRLVVHAGDRLANAYWDGKRAVFGDGDGRAFLPLSGGLDVVAHELFHAVTQAESGLVYEGEPGALNESLSDVFGVLVERDRERDRANWTVGERVASRPLRDLSDPARTGQPAHMKDYVRLRPVPEEDMGGVHTNSTIPSHAAYLLAVGGEGPLHDVTVRGIGEAALRDIWWRAATVYLGPRARFADFAEATVVAAEDLHGAGSSEVEAVRAAWRAVGVRPAGRR
jgi:thermolysin